MSKPLSESQMKTKLHFGNLDQPMSAFPWEFNGFRKQLRQLFNEDADYQTFAEPEDRDHPLSDIRLIPDAFYLDRDRLTAYALEVVESNDLNDQKAAEYCNLAWALDEIYWSLVVIQYYPLCLRTFWLEPIFLDLKPDNQTYAQAVNAMRIIPSDPTRTGLTANPQHRAHVVASFLGIPAPGHDFLAKESES